MSRHVQASCANIISYPILSPSSPGSPGYGAVPLTLKNSKTFKLSKTLKNSQKLLKLQNLLKKSQNILKCLKMSLNVPKYKKSRCVAD